MFILVVIVSLACCSHFICADKPCAARQVAGQSVVCVCNQTYCDQLKRQSPASGQYVAYTSSRDGSRFKKTLGSLLPSDNKTSGWFDTTLELDLSTKFQTIEGFGGAVTDAAGINWKSLSDELQKYLVESYASKMGLEYNILRVPIGGCDFSTHPYAYNELPVDDALLTNFTLAPEDYTYKIPLIKSLMSVATAPIHVLGSIWSPPPWMKTNNKFTGISRLKREFYQTLANYHIKFMDHYAAAGVPVRALTITNEPSNGVLNLAKFNTLGWDIDGMGEYVEKYFGPTIRNSVYKDVKIFAGDDQRITIPYWFNKLVSKHPGVLQYLAGVAVHWYADKITPASVLTAVTESYPDKVILATEACEGSIPGQKHVKPGSWDRAISYISNIIEDMNHFVVGWIDWNICLDTEGGPNWVKNFVDAPIIVNASVNEFIKQPMYYALGHVTKFVPRGSRRVQLTVHKPILSAGLEATAFLTTRSTVVLVVLNKGGARTVTLKCEGQQTSLTLEAESITTTEFLA